jgi:Eukaryotic initiation factor 4E
MSPQAEVNGEHHDSPVDDAKLTDHPSSSRDPASPSTVLNIEPRDTVEWILWRHYCKKLWAQSEEEWNEGVKEVSHLFAHPDAIDLPSAIDLHVPLPSESFFLKTTRHNGQHRAVPQHTEYSLFKKGVLPEWEDPQCHGELFAKHYLPPEHLDAYWLRLVHGVMEGLIDHQYVVGIRIVDKSKGKHPVYKFEVWLNSKCPQVIGKIRKQALDCLQQDEHYRFNLHFRDFDTGLTTAKSETSSSDGN